MRRQLPLLAAAVSLFGCRDTLAPSGAAIPLNASYVPNYTEEAPDDTALTAPGMSVEGASLPASSTESRFYAHPILAEVTFSSSGSGERYYPLSNAWAYASFGIRGEHCMSSSAGRLHFGSHYGVWDPCTVTPAVTHGVSQWTDTIRIRGTASLGRASHSWSADWYASPVTATIRPIPVEMKLRPLSYLGSTVEQLDESTVLLTGNAIELQPYNTPGTARQMKIPLSAPVQAMIFTPDNGGPPVTCNGGWVNDPTYGDTQTYCRLINVTHSGTFTITAMANGKWKTKTMRIIKKQDFILTPDRQSAFVDDSIKFTATVNGIQVPVERWRWNGAIPMDSVSDCTSGHSVCAHQLAAPGPGTMTAYLANGDSASATVTAHDTQCSPTHDPILDDPDVRAGLRLIWRWSNPYDPVTSDRIERAMFVYDSSGHTILRFAEPDSLDDACRSASRLPIPPPGTLKAAFHTHPARFQERVQCKKAGGTAVNDYMFGGPSHADWIRQSTYDQSSVSSYAVDYDNAARMTNVPRKPNGFWTTGIEVATGDTVDVPNPAYWKLQQHYQLFSRVDGSCRRF